MILKDPFPDEGLSEVEVRQMDQISYQSIQDTLHQLHNSPSGEHSWMRQFWAGLSSTDSGLRIPNMKQVLEHIGGQQAGNAANDVTTVVLAATILLAILAVFFRKICNLCPQRSTPSDGTSAKTSIVRSSYQPPDKLQGQLELIDSSRQPVDSKTCLLANKHCLQALPYVQQQC